MSDLETARRALSQVPPDCDRDTWVRMGAALKSEFGNEAHDVFMQWSERAESFKRADAMATWKSIKPSGGVTFATLIYEAKRNGYTPDKTTSPRPPSADEQRERAAQHKAREEAAQREREQAQVGACIAAQRMWDAGTDSSASEYLRRKSAKGYGVRINAKGETLVPLRDTAGVLWNVQRIMPTKPEQGTDKLFIKGGRKSGCFHLIGSLQDARELLVCEGYATGASLHEATSLPVAISFDAGNISNVCKAIHAEHPSLLILVCGDDDSANHAGGKNPGKDAAIQAANAVGGRWVLPSREHLPANGSDFNDQHQHAGLDSVKAVIEAALASVEKNNVKPLNVPSAQIPQKQKTKLKVVAPAKDTEDGASTAPHTNAVAIDPFAVTDEGVIFLGVDRNGQPTKLWVCSRLEVNAKTRDTAGDGWGYVLAFTNADGVKREWVLPARMLAGDGNEYRSILMAMGLRIGHTTAAKQALTRYIQTRNTDARARTVDRLGWHGGRVYVLPRETIGETEERVIFQSEGAIESHFSQRGTLEKWHAEIGIFCAGNSRFMFAVCAAFSGIMLRPSGLDSGGFHFVGDSSSGKTTALRVACSVLGAPEYMKRWRATDNGLESLAVQRCDALMILDELAQLDARVAGEAAYLLANETAKTRATKAGTSRASVTWKTLILSAGEVGLAAHMAEANKRPRAGQEIRLIDLPADAGAGFGAFDVLHGETDGAALSNRLVRACAREYGTPGRVFLEWAVAHADELPTRLRSRIDALENEWLPPNASGQVHRAARRFALVAASGELAIEAGAVQWPMDEPARAAKVLFDAFVASRGGFANSEKYQMIRQCRAFFDAHGSARFEDVTRVGDDHAPKTMHRAGYRLTTKFDAQEKTEAFDYLISLETFRAEVAQGFDYKAMLRLIKEAGLLKVDRGRSFDCKVRIKGVTERYACYRISSDVHGWEADHD